MALPAAVSVAVRCATGVVGSTVIAVALVRPCVGDGNVSSLSWRMPKVFSYLASVAHSAVVKADVKVVPTWRPRSPEARITASYFAWFAA